MILGNIMCLFMKTNINQLINHIRVVGAFLILASILAIPCIANDDLVGKDRIITDMDDRMVTIPSDIQSVIITCCGGATQELVALGVGNRVTAQPSKCTSERLFTIVPEYQGIPDVGSFDDVNIEEILKLNPDIVIGSYYAEKGNDIIENAGIPVICVLTGRAGINELKQEFRMLGTVFGTEERTERLIAYWDKTLSNIKSKLDDIPDNERKKVYYMSSKPLTTEGHGAWGDDMIQAAGGINVAGGIDQIIIRGGHEISPEELIQWNPEVIYAQSSMKDYSSSVDEFLENPQFRDIKAVQDKAVYACPVGTFWWDRPGPESPLGIIWLAKKLYPDKFTDVNLADEAKTFSMNFIITNLLMKSWIVFLIQLL